jgi:DNA mismatch repair protein MutS
MSLTPMMQQYQEAKAACPDALLLFRMGDFYELFYEDAKTAARVLNLALTSREKGENAVPMAGFPHHQLESYLAKILAAGLRAAVCEQVEDPREARGLVRREVTRVVSRGTITDEALLDPRESNYLCAVLVAESAPPPQGRPMKGGSLAGLAWVDLSTGRFLAAAVAPDRLADELARIAPAECLLPQDAPPPPIDPQRTTLTRRPPWAFATEQALQVLSRQFGTHNLEGFGFGPADTPALRAAGAVLDYLLETQKASLAHVDALLPYRQGDRLEIDEATRRSLEIARTLREGRREGSLLWVLDRTISPMGSRLLAEWVAAPLVAREPIEERLEAVEQFVRQPSLSQTLRTALRQVYDVERLLARVHTGRATPRDLGMLCRTLRALPEIKTALADATAALLQRLHAQLDPCTDLEQALADALAAGELPLASREGGIIRSGYHPELDRLRSLMHGGKEWLARYQAEQSSATGIPNLKIGFHQVFGYYLEVTNPHRDKVPAHYVRKQTIKNAERYITPELKEHEERVLKAEEQAKLLEYDLFCQLKDLVQQASPRLRASAAALAQLDVLAGLAELARQRGYCRPRLVEEPVLHVIEGRHAVLDAVMEHGRFVPNDTMAGPDDGLILLITGPNMAGKSTYIRQVALLTIMAQLGSFVPAKEATLGLADRIFARIGASDELARGQSTFMVEMTETARILHNATPRSLVILDEIGRGTSTYDGVSLAWAVVEFLHDRNGCRTLFATHYHELTELARSLPKVRNLNVAVREWQDEVIFLHKIVPGAADKSYGIHVARLAGVPRDVLERAKEILARLEQEHLDPSEQPRLARRPRIRRREVQLTLFAAAEHPVVNALKGLDVNRLTPLEALSLLKRLQEQAVTPNGEAASTT